MEPLSFKTTSGRFLLCVFLSLLWVVTDANTATSVTTPTIPPPPNAEDFKSVAQNETSITLQWKNVENILNYTLLFSGGEKNVTASAGQELVTDTIVELTSGTLYNFTLVTVFEKVRSSGVNHDAPTVPLMVISVNNTQRSLTNITLTWPIVNEDWYYFLQINGEISQIHPNRDMDVVFQTIKHLQPGTKYPFSLITGFSGLNSTAYDDYTVTAIDCTKGTWRVTNSSIQGMIEGVFSSATATNKTQTHVSPGGGNVSFAGLYPGATYDVSLVYERKSTTWLQCSHNVTIIPAYLSADCEYVAAGYSVSIVWNKPEGVWTSVEVNVTGESHTVHGNDKRRLQISGFQPAQTYEVSLALLSGTERSHEPFVFSCLTDPRGIIAAGAALAIVIVCLAVLIFIVSIKK